MRRNILFVFLVVLIGCVPDFQNPIDPENPNSIPPTPKLEEVSLIPYDNLIVYRGKLNYSYQNANGIFVERGVAGKNFEVIDTLFPPALEFSNSVSDDDSLEYQFRLRAFNQNGVSAYSLQKSFEGKDTVDLFPPKMSITHDGNPLGAYKIVQDSIVSLRIKVWDESPLQSLVINGDSISLPDSLSAWRTFTDTLRKFTNQYVLEVTDASEQNRKTLDTVVLYYDFPNDLPVLEAIPDGSQLKLKWKAQSAPDFVAWHLWMSQSSQIDTSLDSDFSSDNAKDSVYTIENFTPESQSYLLMLEDSAGNFVRGENSKVWIQNSLFKRNKMVLIPAGSFVDINGKAATLTKDFYMDSTEVTQKHFAEVMGYNPSVYAGENNPVDAVSFSDAMQYCNRRSLLEGFDTVYSYSGIDGGDIADFKIRSVIGYRLPTEDEWELAARGGKDSIPYFWGDSTVYDTIRQYAWFSKNAGQDRSLSNLPFAQFIGPQQVAFLLPNDFGLYDMLGNVDEWTLNYWESENDRESGREDDLGPESCGIDCQSSASEFLQEENRRTVRGGNWQSRESNLTLSSRLAQEQSTRTRTTGFRPVLERITQ